MGTLHITSGDIAGKILTNTGLSGEVFVWHDVLYDGPRNSGWPDRETFAARALFLEQMTGGGLARENILETLQHQYAKLAGAGDYDQIVLWFDACLFDQSMLAHILACMHQRNIRPVELICTDSFPGILPFHGLGQLQSGQMASLYSTRLPVSTRQFKFAVQADKAFATRNLSLLTDLVKTMDCPLPFIPAAAQRLLQEQPDPITGLGRLESLALKAIIAGCDTPGEIFNAVAAADTPPQYWGDITLWEKINQLAARNPPLVIIEGPSDRLPQWGGDKTLKNFTVRPWPNRLELPIE